MAIFAPNPLNSISSTRYWRQIVVQLGPHQIQHFKITLRTNKVNGVIHHENIFFNPRQCRRWRQRHQNDLRCLCRQFWCYQQFSRKYSHNILSCLFQLFSTLEEPFSIVEVWWKIDNPMRIDNHNTFWIVNFATYSYCQEWFDNFGNSEILLVLHWWVHSALNHFTQHLVSWIEVELLWSSWWHDEALGGNPVGVACA